MNSKNTAQINTCSNWHRYKSLGASVSTAEGVYVYLHGIFIAVPDPSEDIFSLPCPPDGATRQGDHAQALLNPFAPGHLSIHVHPFLCCPAFVTKVLVALVVASICAAIFSVLCRQQALLYLLLHTQQDDSHKRMQAEWPYAACITQSEA